MMHAGEALWTLYAFAVHLERKNVGKSSVINKVAKCTEACQVLATHMNYGLPTGAVLDQWVAAFDQQAADPVAAGKSSSKTSNLALDEAKLKIKQCREMLEEINSDSDAAADYVERTKDKLEKIEEGMDKYNNLLDWQKDYLDELPDKIGRWIR